MSENAERKFVVGTRGSALARWQTDHVNARLVEHAGASGRALAPVDVKIITTRGDVDMRERLQGKLEKGFFTEEIEAELRSGVIDWAVHSLKDLPTRLADDLAVAAVLPRADPFDLLLVRPEFVDPSADGTRLPLKSGARVGTSSLRRETMLRTYADGCEPQPLRGNVPTRLEKLATGKYDAIVLAAAGVRRLGLPLGAFRVFELSPVRWQPAPGQGAVAIESRANDPAVSSYVGVLDDAATRYAAETERAFLRELEGGCTTPFGAYVLGHDAHLGIARDGRWHALHTRIPVRGSAWEPVARDAILQILTQLQQPASKETSDHDLGPLWRAI